MVRRLVLFDIDGTILWTDGAGRAAIRAALLHEVGITGPLEQVRFDGKTDPQIVRELLALAEHPAAQDEARIAAVCSRYVGLLEAELVARRQGIRVLPGVVPLLDALEGRGDAVLGLLTGNLERGAQLKLQAAGLDPGRFRVGAFGSDAADRPALPAIACRRAAALFGRVPWGDDVVIVGDTPADMTCGRSVGARAIGVSTGSYAREDLVAAGAHAVFDSLANTQAVLQAMYA